MDFDFELLQPCEEPFYGIVPGKGSYPIVRVVLQITFGTQANYCPKYLIFDVANFKTFYHASKFMAIPYHTYLVLKMPAPNGVLSIYGDVETSYKCYIKAFQLVEALELSAKTTAIIAKA
ncbi:uncharacterized protein LOC105914747 [Setaria italica]|uniref:uncharacterized protein LOC105914747 n=1 Tax=Setaria italica TaxID=4555 RepID=UPI000648DABD|nr:uncharacterized protein LOC105914747 [Setaria italica]XP_034604601.1 uncharacterized protein LOC117864582 [Setaria viridis]